MSQTAVNSSLAGEERKKKKYLQTCCSHCLQFKIQSLEMSFRISVFLFSKSLTCDKKFPYLRRRILMVFIIRIRPLLHICGTILSLFFSWTIIPIIVLQPSQNSCKMVPAILDVGGPTICMIEKKKINCNVTFYGPTPGQLQASVMVTVLTT